MYRTNNKTKNPNCDGAQCGDPTGEVRKYPSGGGYLILCITCAAHENHYRFLRACETGQPDNWPQANWFQCEVYGHDG